MAPLPDPLGCMPDVGPPSEDARRTLALHALADLRRQLVEAQDTLAGAIAELVALGDLKDRLPPLD